MNERMTKMSDPGRLNLCVRAAASFACSYSYSHTMTQAFGYVGRCSEPAGIRGMNCRCVEEGGGCM